MTPDIQQLKEKALIRKGWGDAMLMDPSTILALIEVVERQREALEEAIQMAQAFRALFPERREFIDRFRNTASAILKGAPDGR